jgi:acetyl-CoA carboxylase carboxyl transferase subunit alpha
MFQYAVYSVISPEGCASILWRTGDKAADAAQAMKMTADDLKALRIIDRIVAEPIGGAHRDHGMAAAALATAIDEELAALSGFSSKELLQQRRAKFLSMGA